MCPREMRLPVMMKLAPNVALETQATQESAVTHARNGPFRKLPSQLAYKLLLCLIRMSSLKQSVAQPQVTQSLLL